jgi:pimeloyl-ACP methyl ester carboxylesterase
VPFADDVDACPFNGPVLVVTGRQDSAVGFRAQWRLLERFPRSTYAVLDRAGHNAQVEQPEVFAALVREWLERVTLACASPELSRA